MRDISIAILIPWVLYKLRSLKRVKSRHGVEIAPNPVRRIEERWLADDYLDD